MMQNYDPAHIAVSKSRGVKIDWKDGHSSDYPIRYLRDRCPCATCTGGHGAQSPPNADPNPLQMYKPALKIESVEPIGSYAIRLGWNDGHNTGIYSFAYLREICPCCGVKEAGS